MNLNETQPTFPFEKVLKRRKYFLISKKSLDEIRNGNARLFRRPLQLEFEQLLESNNLVLLDVNEELKLIKKIV